MSCSECQSIRNKIAFGQFVSPEEYEHLQSCRIDTVSKKGSDWDWPTPYSMTAIRETYRGKRWW